MNFELVQRIKGHRKSYYSHSNGSNITSVRQVDRKFMTIIKEYAASKQREVKFTP